ncbi:MAG: hypothetical protein Ct9H300mP7_2720 [Verrucomicrobiota bacterium]|nr:MAG: hypothetical protein Ct9H300mP7_2720 [Verrucomicrobiota bacterium]
MIKKMNRREFVKQSSLAVGAMGAAAAVGCQSLAGGSSNSLYDISLAQWSLNRQFFGGKLNALDFAKVTKEEFDLDAIEYVNQFFKDKAKKRILPWPIEIARGRSRCEEPVDHGRWRRIAWSRGHCRA